MKLLCKNQSKSVMGGAIWDLPGFINQIMRFSNAMTQVQNAMNSKNPPTVPGSVAAPKGDKHRDKATNKQPGKNAKSGVLEDKGVTVVRPH